MAKIKIKGAIVSNDDKWAYDFFGLEATSPNEVADALEKANGEQLEVLINSPGGDVFAGSEIYTLLKDYKGEVTIKITGVAASMGSVIAMAGDKVKISPTAQIMIHNVWSMAVGDYRDMKHESDVLKNMNRSIAAAYQNKTGLSENELLGMMDRETWMNAQEAKEKGFVDEILFEEKNMQMVACASHLQLLPKQVINKLRNMQDKIKNPVESSKDEIQSGILLAKFNYLKLKGVIL
jgi:ATP-dependent Clp protease, protease subunit